MRLVNADVDELERKDELHEDFEEEGDEGAASRVHKKGPGI